MHHSGCSYTQDLSVRPSAPSVAAATAASPPAPVPGFLPKQSPAPGHLFYSLLCSSRCVCFLALRFSDLAFPELQKQLAFTTSSQKKRRITRQSTREHNKPEDSVLPSTEIDTDPAFSFSAASVPDLRTPTFLRADSLPPSSVPPRLQSQGAFLTDPPSSDASSPCAASADLSIEFDREPDLLDSSTLQQPEYRTTRDQSPVHQSVRRALMGGAADSPQRSSSPLKRRASSMEPEQDILDGREDVDMLAATDSQTTEAADGSRGEQGEQGTKASEMAPSDAKAELPLRNGNAMLSAADHCSHSLC